MTSLETVAQRVAEFNAHVWDHTKDEFQQQFDVRRKLTDAEYQSLNRLVDALAKGESDEQIAAKLLVEVQKRPDFILMALQVIGSTRNKIITDLRATLSGQGVRIPQSPTRLHINENIWRVAGPYIAARLRNVCTALTDLDNSRRQALEAINQATWPGWVRQERAKRQGHEAEYRLAILYATLGVSFAPEEKADNPLSRDAQVNEVSFDLVVPNATSPLVCVKSTVHTSNIGQFGESKDALEISEAADMLKSNFPDDTPTLLALIDGVGFNSNKAGLEGVLTNADEFCQFKTLWKAGVIAASRLDRKIVIKLPQNDIESHQSFLARWNKLGEVQPLDEQPGAGWVQAGEGFILLGN